MSGFEPTGGGDNWFTGLVHGAMGAVGNIVGGAWTAASDVMKPFDWAISKGSQVGAAGWLTANPASKDFLQPGQAWNDTDPSNPNAVSPGQAFLSNPVIQTYLQPLSIVTGNAGRSPFGGVPLNSKGGLDPTDPKVRQQAFESGGLGEISSFSTDVLYQAFNPTTDVLYGVKPVAAAIGGSQYMDAARLAKLNDRTSQVVAAREAGADLTTAPKAVQGWADLFANRTTAPDLVNQHWLFRGPSGRVAARAFIDAKTDADAQLVLRFASGDLSVQAELASREPVIYATMTDMDGARAAEKVAADDLFASLGMPPGWAQANPEREAFLDAKAKDIKSQYNWVQLVTGGAGENDAGIFGSLADRSVSPFGFVNDLHTKGAVARAARIGDLHNGFFASQTLQPQPGGPILKVLGWWQGKQPKGWITTQGPRAADSHIDLEEALARAPGVTPEQRSAWVAMYNRAWTASDRQAVLETVDAQAAKMVVGNRLDKLNLTPEAKADTMAYVDTYMGKYHQYRSALQDSIAKNKGYMYDLARGEQTLIQGLDSQQAQHVLLTNYAVLDKALAHASHTDIRSALAVGGDAVAASATALGSLWKTGVLLRLGATPRNLGESWLASTVHLGWFPGSPISGTANVAVNGYRRLAAKLDPFDPIRVNPHAQTPLTVAKGLEGKVYDLEHQRSIDLTTLEQDTVNHAAHVGTDLEEETAAALAQTQARIASWDEQIANVRNDLVRLRSKSVPEPIKRAGTGIVTEAGVGGRTYTAPAALEGLHGTMAERNFGQAEVTRYTTQVMESRRAQAAALSRAYDRETGRYRLVDPPKDIAAEAHTKYWQASADWANRYAHNSQIVQHIWRGESPQDTTAWLRGTTEGRGVLEEMHLLHTDYDGVLDHVQDIATNTLAAYPDPALREYILANADVNPEIIKAHLQGRTDLVPTLSPELIPKIPSSGMELVNNGIDRAFKLIWAQPETRLARMPLYNTLYTQRWHQIVRQNQDMLAKMSYADAQKWVEKYAGGAARQYAGHNVQRIIYSVDRRSNPAEALRFIAPFAQVTGNRLYFYGTQLLENPHNMSRLFTGWHALSTETDDQGNQTVRLHFPGFLAKWLGVESTPDMVIPKTSLNLVQNSEPWWSPGFGPIVAAPIAAYMRGQANPPKVLTELLGDHGIGMFPNNYYGDNLTAQFAPTWVRRLLGETGPQWANNYAQIATIENWKYDNGMRDTVPTKQEITDRTNGLWSFRVLSAIASPVQPTLHNPVVDHYVKIHSDYVKKYKQEADTHFLADYPEYFNIVINYSKNESGVLPTGIAASRADQYSDLMGNLSDPSMRAMVTNLATDDGTFDSNAYHWEYGRPVAPGSAEVLRGPKALGTPMDDRLVSKGWIMYRAAAKERDSLLKGLGFTSINSAGAEWIKALFDTRKQAIITATSRRLPDGTMNSPWWQDLQQQDNATYANRAQDLQRILTYPGYADANKKDQPWLQSASRYLQLRQQVQALLTQQGEIGGSSNITAASNAWIDTMWQAQTKALRDADPQWAEWSARYFSNDDLRSVPGA